MLGTNAISSDNLQSKLLEVQACIQRKPWRSYPRECETLMQQVVDSAANVVFTNINDRTQFTIMLSLIATDWREITDRADIFLPLEGGIRAAAIRALRTKYTDATFGPVNLRTFVAVLRVEKLVPPAIEAIRGIEQILISPNVTIPEQYVNEALEQLRRLADSAQPSEDVRVAAGNALRSILNIANIRAATATTLPALLPPARKPSTSTRTEWWIAGAIAAAAVGYWFYAQRQRTASGRVVSRNPTP